MCRTMNELERTVADYRNMKTKLSDMSDNFVY